MTTSQRDRYIRELPTLERDLNDDDLIPVSDSTDTNPATRVKAARARQFPHGQGDRNVQSDLSENNPADDSYIRNKDTFRPGPGTVGSTTLDADTPEKQAAFRAILQIVEHGYPDLPTQAGAYDIVVAQDGTVTLEPITDLSNVPDVPAATAAAQTYIMEVPPIGGAAARWVLVNLGQETARRIAGDMLTSTNVSSPTQLTNALNAQMTSDEQLELVFTAEVVLDGNTYEEGLVAFVGPRGNAIERRFILGQGSGGALADGSVTTPKLADQAVTARKIGAGALRASHFPGTSQDTSPVVQTKDIFRNAVTGDKIPQNSINNGHMLDNAIGTPELQDDAVTESKLASAVRAQLGGGMAGVDQTARDAAAAAQATADAKQSRRQILEVFPSELTDDMMGSTFAFQFTAYLNREEIPDTATHISFWLGGRNILSGPRIAISEIPSDGTPIQSSVSPDHDTLQNQFVATVQANSIGDRNILAGVEYYNGNTPLGGGTVQPVRIPVLTQAPLSYSTNASIWPLVDATRPPGPLQTERRVELIYPVGHNVEVNLNFPTEFAISNAGVTRGNIMTVTFVQPAAGNQPFRFRTGRFFTYPGAQVPTINMGGDERTTLRFLRSEPIQGNSVWYHLGRIEERPASTSGPGNARAFGTAAGEIHPAAEGNSTARWAINKVLTAAQQAVVNGVAFTAALRDKLTALPTRAALTAELNAITAANDFVVDLDGTLAPTDDNANKIRVYNGRMFNNVLHSATDPVVAYRDFAEADWRSAVGDAAAEWGGAVQTSQANQHPANYGIYSIPGGQFERRLGSGFPAYFQVFPVANFRGAGDNKADADEKITAIGDIVYYGGTVRVATSFMAGATRHRTWEPIEAVPAEGSVTFDKLADALLATQAQVESGDADQLATAAIIKAYVEAFVPDLRGKFDTASTPAGGDRWFFTDENQSGDPVRYIDHRSLHRIMMTAPEWSDIAQNTNIQVGLIVFHNGSYWGCITQHNRSGTGPDGDATNWLNLGATGGTIADGSIGSAKLDADTEAKKAAFRLAIGASAFTVGNALPAAAATNPGDLHLFITSVSSGLVWRDRDGTTNLTSAGALDVGIYDGGRFWRRVANLADPLLHLPQLRSQVMAYNAALTLNPNLGYTGLVTLTGNATLKIEESPGRPGGNVGDVASLIVTQDGTGSRTLTLDRAILRYHDVAAPTLTTDANAIDELLFRKVSTTAWYLVGHKRIA